MVPTSPKFSWFVVDSETWGVAPTQLCQGYTMTQTNELSIDVRVMEADEFAAMRAVAVAAFADESIGALLDQLRQSWSWRDELAFVAVRNDEIVAQVLYSYATLDAPHALVDVLVLSPVGVRPDLQLQGIGSHLIRQSLIAVERRADPLVFLEGSPLYYPRFGFTPGGERGFIKPSQRIPDPAFMVRTNDESGIDLSGTLVYPDVFWRTDSVGLR